MEQELYVDRDKETKIKFYDSIITFDKYGIKEINMNTHTYKRTDDTSKYKDEVEKVAIFKTGHYGYYYEITTHTKNGEIIDKVMLSTWYFDVWIRGKQVINDHITYVSYGISYLNNTAEFRRQKRNPAVFKYLNDLYLRMLFGDKIIEYGGTTPPLETIEYAMTSIRKTDKLDDIKKMVQNGELYEFLQKRNKKMNNRNVWNEETAETVFQNNFKKLSNDVYEYIHNSNNLDIYMVINATWGEIYTLVGINHFTSEFFIKSGENMTMLTKKMEKALKKYSETHDKKHLERSNIIVTDNNLTTFMNDDNSVNDNKIDVFKYWCGFINHLSTTDTETLGDIINKIDEIMPSLNVLKKLKDIN